MSAGLIKSTVFPNIEGESILVNLKFEPGSSEEKSIKWINYVENKIFNVGDIVENLNTGLIGKITRRGSNHLICVTENGIMFKAWLKDLTEYTEVSMDSMMRDKTHPNTLVGTKGFLKYVTSMTPGAEANKKFLYRTGGGKPINIKRKKVGKRNA